MCSTASRAGCGDECGEGKPWGDANADSNPNQELQRAWPLFRCRGLDAQSDQPWPWQLDHASAGKRKTPRYRPGRACHIGLGEAREAASKIRKDTRAGIDVLAERKKERIVVPTFQDAAKQVRAEHKAAWKNGKRQAQWIATLETYVFPARGNRLVAEIEGPSIRDVLSPIWLTKPETARRVRQRIGAVLDWAYAKGFRSSEAPNAITRAGIASAAEEASSFRGATIRRYSCVSDLAARARNGRSACA